MLQHVSKHNTAVAGIGVAAASCTLAGLLLLTPAGCLQTQLICGWQGGGAIA
jgi:hypothetical protein